jgi:hypothetical protein
MRGWGILGVVLGLALVGLAATEPGIFRDEGHGFQLAYPAGAVVRWSGVPLRIDLPVSPGTTLREKFLWVEVNRTPPAPGAEEVVVQGRAFYLEAGVEGAAGSVYEYWRYYTALPDGEWLVFTCVLHSVNPAMLDSPPPEFDRQRELDSFLAILASVSTFPPGAGPGDVAQ